MPPWPPEEEQEHLESCSYRPVKCRHGCDAQPVANQEEEHAADCDWDFVMLLGGFLPERLVLMDCSQSKLSNGMERHVIYKLLREKRNFKLVEGGGPCGLRPLPSHGLPSPRSWLQ